MTHPAIVGIMRFASALSQEKFLRFFSSGTVISHPAEDTVVPVLGIISALDTTDVHARMAADNTLGTMFAPGSQWSVPGGAVFVPDKPLPMPWHECVRVTHDAAVSQGSAGGFMVVEFPEDAYVLHHDGINATLLDIASAEMIDAQDAAKRAHLSQ